MMRGLHPGRRYSLPTHLHGQHKTTIYPETRHFITIGIEPIKLASYCLEFMSFHIMLGTVFEVDLQQTLLRCTLHKIRNGRHTWVAYFQTTERSHNRHCHFFGLHLPGPRDARLPFRFVEMRFLTVEMVDLWQLRKILHAACQHRMPSQRGPFDGSG